MTIAQNNKLKMEKLARAFTLICIGSSAVFLLFSAAVSMKKHSGPEDMWLILPLIIMFIIHLSLGTSAIILVTLSLRFLRNFWVFLYFLLFISVAVYLQFDAEHWKTQRAAKLEMKQNPRAGELVNAFKAYDYALAEKLLQEGVNADPVSDRIFPMLWSMGWDGNLNAVKLLVKYGADIDQKRASGRTLLLQMLDPGNHGLNSSNEQYDYIASFLIESGADVNIHEKHRGITALMLAAKRQKPELVSKLILAGADVDARDIEGKKALDYAQHARTEKEIDHEKILELLSR